MAARLQALQPSGQKKAKLICAARGLTEQLSLCCTLSNVSSFRSERCINTLQVQRFVLRSFLLRNWSPDQLNSQLTLDFVAHEILPAVTRPATLIKGD